ncbi:MAG: hypothetical protein D6734_08765 [Candidatus Schekmanbacteria bacterium]|nr:MAG: hypothetical protein D6734_08765 [Candidatus Schekmanbacteria bacterium]
MNFSTIKGHRKPIALLKNALKKKTVPHSFIFQGPSGIGKKMTAQVFAKAINCLDDNNGEICGKCENCISIKNRYTFFPDIRIYRNLNERLWIDRVEILNSIYSGQNIDDSVLEEYAEALKALEECGIILPNPLCGLPHSLLDCIDLNKEILFTKDTSDGSLYIDSQCVEKLSENLKSKSPLAVELFRKLVMLNNYVYNGRLPIGRRGVRGIIQDIYLKPTEGRKKVFIIDNAHNITEEAADALLKTLEEPPNDSILILITSNPRGLLQTIKSRCETIRFSYLEKGDFISLLNEKIPKNEIKWNEVYPFSDGSPGKALGIALFDIERIKKLAFDSLFGDTKDENLLLSRFVEEGIFDERTGNGVEKIDFFLTCFRKILRDIIFFKKGIEDDSALPDEIVEKLRNFSESKLKKLEDIFFKSCQLSDKLDRNFNTQLMVEEFLLQLSAY